MRQTGGWVGQLVSILGLAGAERAGDKQPFQQLHLCLCVLGGGAAQPTVSDSDDKANMPFSALA
mgnify:CR=1 FL=1